MKRNAAGEAGAWAFGKEFVGLLRDRQVPRMDGRTGAAFCIWWGEVSEDSDGPLESLRTWAEEHSARPSDLGVRMTYLVSRSSVRWQGAGL